MDRTSDVHDTLPDTAHVALLADFCKEELAAAETYKRALSLNSLRKEADVLSRCYASHQQRASELRQRISDLGGKPPTAPGAWGSLIPALTSAAAAVSESFLAEIGGSVQGVFVSYPPVKPLSGTRPTV